jgi:uncharacterized protein (DUF362 family)
LAEWKAVIPPGAAVSLKVNLGWDLFLPGSITSPLVAEALIRELRPHVGEIFMVEADQVLEDVERAWRRSGMADVCRRTGVRWINMTGIETVPLELPGNRILPRVDVPRILRDTLLVTVPVMKTHAKTALSGALKNQWGCLPVMRHEYHLVLDEALADLNSVVRPVLALMDATVALEGNGPKSGRPRVVDRILCSQDPVALDTVQARIMGLDPRAVGHLARCAERGIGTNREAEIDVRGSARGEPPLAFLPARHNAVSFVETLLRRSALKRLVFDTPIFRICLWGAKLHYRIWSRRHAAALWEPIRRHALYGPQWNEGWGGLE